MEQQMMLSIVDTETGEARQSALFELTDELIDRMSSTKREQLEAGFAAVKTFGERLGRLEVSGKVNPWDVCQRIADYVAGLAMFAGFDEYAREQLRNAGFAAADTAKVRAEVQRESEAS